MRKGKKYCIGYRAEGVSDGSESWVQEESHKHRAMESD